MSSLIDLLDLHEKACVALIGSGGKTTLMYQMAGELSRSEHRVITSTTTHIFIPSRAQSPHWMLLEGGVEPVRRFWDTSRAAHITLGWKEAGGKLDGVPFEMLEEIFHWDSLDMLLVEADGSRNKSLKGYCDHEPALLPCASKVIVVAGLNLLGESFNRDLVHRPEVIEKLLLIRQGDRLNPSHISALLLDERGYLAKAGAGEKYLILNGIAGDCQYEAALDIVAELRKKSGNVRVLLRGSFFGFVPGTDYYETVDPENRVPPV